MLLLVLGFIGSRYLNAWNFTAFFLCVSKTPLGRDTLLYIRVLLTVFFGVLGVVVLLAWPLAWMAQMPATIRPARKRRVQSPGRTMPVMWDRLVSSGVESRRCSLSPTRRKA